MTHRQITTEEEVIDLAADSVVKSRGGIIWQKTRVDWQMTGDENYYVPSAISLPALVIWEPEQ